MAREGVGSYWTLNESSKVALLNQAHLKGMEIGVSPVETEVSPIGTGVSSVETGASPIERRFSPIKTAIFTTVSSRFVITLLNYLSSDGDS